MLCLQCAARVAMSLKGINLQHPQPASSVSSGVYHLGSLVRSLSKAGPEILSQVCPKHPWRSTVCHLAGELGAVLSLSHS